MHLLKWRVFARRYRGLFAFIATASLLFAAPTSAIAGEVAVAPVEFVGQLPGHVKDDIRDTIVDTLAALDVDTVMLNPSCESTQCSLNAAQERDTMQMLEVQVLAKDRIYTLEFGLFDTMGQELARRSDVCELCGEQELLDALAAGILMLQGPLIRGATSPRLVLRGRPANANVILDGVLVGRAPIELEVAAGPHIVELQAEGRARQAHRWKASAGVDELFEYSLARGSGRGAQIGGWFSFALGLAGMGAGAALLVIDGRDHEPSCGPGQRDNFGVCPNVYTTGVAGIVSASAGAATLTTGVGLLIFDAGRRHKQPVAVLAPAGLGFNLRF